MLLNVNGEWVEGAEALPETLPWDPTLQANMGGVGDNRGCPPGYFCEYVSAADWWNPFFIVGSSPAYERVCRRADEIIMNDGGVTLSEETSEGTWEATVEAAAAATRVPVEALKDALPYVAIGLGSTAFLIGAGAVAYLLLMRR